jgi:hypothetical protein
LECLTQLTRNLSWSSGVARDIVRRVRVVFEVLL